jgi:hypothetical protein
MVCFRCGKCCFFNGQKCPFLIILKSGTTLCRIYAQREREGFKPKLINNKFYCVRIGTHGTTCQYVRKA